MCKGNSPNAGAPEIEVTDEMVRAATELIEDYLQYSTTAAAIDVEAVLRAALQVRNAAEQEKRDAALK